MSTTEKEDNPCTLTSDDGTHYDSNPLSSSSADYEATVGETNFKSNVCRAVVSESWNVDEPENVAGFVSREEGDFSLGQVNTTLHMFPSSSDPILYLDGGSPCPNNPEEQASTAIRFVCTPSIFEAGEPQSIAASPPSDSDQSCHFVFEWKTHVACPTNRKAELQQGHYLVFFAISFIAILTWFAGHTFYNRFYSKKRGIDQFPVPHVSMPQIKLPSFKKASAPSGPKWGFGRRSQRTGYTAMNQDETQHFAGRFSLSDDDEDDHEDSTGGAEDARVSGGEAREWRGQPRREEVEEGRVGVHRGLVDV